MAYTVAASTTIDAPRAVVWDVLMDWQSYREWNPFVRNQCLTDPSRRPLPASQQTPRAGAHLLIHPVHIPPSFESPKLFPAAFAFVVITHLDPDAYRCAWESVLLPAWLLSAERWQVLTETAEGQTRYESVEVFGGVLAPLVRLFVGRGLEEGVRAMGEGLKRRAEMSHLRHGTATE